MEEIPLVFVRNKGENYYPAVNQESTPLSIHFKATDNHNNCGKQKNSPDYILDVFSKFPKFIALYLIKLDTESQK